MKIRIFALAKELDIDSKLLIDYCAQAGITIKNSALASISPEERDLVLALIPTTEVPKPAPPVARPTDFTLPPLPPETDNEGNLRTIRIYLLASELKVDSKLLIDCCSKIGVAIPNSVLARISPAERDRVIAELRNAFPITPQEPPSPLDQATARIDAALAAQKTSVDLSRLDLVSVPVSILEIPHLIELNLSGNLLTVFPDVIAKLPHLRKLVLSNNKLSSLPDDFQHCADIVELLLDHNAFTDIPLLIGSLRKLRRLDMSCNAIVSLDPFIEHAIRGHYSRIGIQYLNLADNQIESLPDEGARFKTLRIIDVSNNSLSTIPASIGELRRINRISLSKNKITAIPSAISNLRRLRHLDLSQNSLKELPYSLRKNDSLTSLLIAGNEGLGLPKEIVEPTREEGQGGTAPSKQTLSAHDILNYYFTRVESGGRPLNEVKLLIVGRGNSGKTSLVETMIQGKPFNPGQQETPGIAIASWKLIVQNEAVDVNVWDFAGQEITHETHRFFLTERSMYLLVLDGRHDTQQDDADYWLSHVEKYGQESPVIVALNKWESPGGYHLKRKTLQRRFKFIRGFIETDCATGLGLKHLRVAIQSLISSPEMDDVRTKFPISWFGVKEQLSQMRQSGKYFLSFQDYSGICVSAGISATDPQETLARILNRLGSALYYGDNPRLRDTRVLVPDWVVNGVYALLRGVQKRGNIVPGQGMLPAPAIKKALSDGMQDMSGTDYTDYPATTHGFLINLMVDRELCFESTDETLARTVYLFPELLNDDEPEDIDVGRICETAQTRFAIAMIFCQTV